MKMIVGLGNPGKEYDKTRHNVGFMMIDNYCKNETFQKKFNGLYITKKIFNEKVIFLKPQSYMNLSGDVVSEYARYYNIDSSDILIIRDDLDLNIGSHKLKFNSSSGGNNGIKSIINRLGTQSFCQLKIGISNNKTIETKDYVLGTFKQSELDLIDKQKDTVNKIIDSFIESGINKTMNDYNGEKDESNI